MDEHLLEKLKNDGELVSERKTDHTKWKCS